MHACITHTTNHHSRRAKKFEEKVVLLTTKALYVCSYNYKLEKVVQFRRIELHMLLGIQTGEYILSSTTPQSRDIEQNYGFLLYYDADHELTRMNTGSIRNQNLGDLNIGNSRRNSSSSNQEKPPSIAGSAPEEEKGHENDSSSDSDSDKEEEDGRMFLAFKAVRYNVLGELSDDQQSCRKQVQEIAYQISKACGQENDPQFLYDKPIIRFVYAMIWYGRYWADSAFFVIASSRLRIPMASSKRWDSRSSMPCGCRD